MFSDLHITNFRGFGDMKLSGLGRVNLIVGKNNTGKTSLLEALTLVSSPDQYNSLPGLFRANPGSVGARYYRWLRRDGIGSENGLIEASGFGGARSVVLRSKENPQSISFATGGTSISNEYHSFHSSVEAAKRPLKLRAISVQHRAPDDMVAAFSAAVRPKEGEQQMEALLRSVDERIQSVRLDSVPQAAPFIVVDIGMTERVPLSQAGQGIYRLVAIFSEILGHRPQIVFIDEIENGIHHSVMQKVWDGIAAVAELAQVQIFATTHSHECLEAAHEAFAQRKSYDLRVIQLYRIGNATDGRVLDQTHIKAALAGEIELR